MNYRVIYGRNAVMAALNSSYNIDRILISSGARNCENLLHLAKNLGIVVKLVNSFKLKQFPNCQGVVAFAVNLQYFNLNEVLNFELQKQRRPFFLVCDKIFDPHNLGALIRTAAAAGVSGVVMAKRGCCPLTPVVEKASAGAVNFVKLIKTSNLASAIDVLKKAGVFVYCADLDGSCVFEQNLEGAIAIVLGSEGRGISPLIKKKCDSVLTIPMFGPTKSLNVSVAGGILMCEIARQRNFN